MAEDDAVLGRRIRELRRRRGLSLEALAGLAGMSTGMLSYFERGLRTLERRSHIEGLAWALQVAPSELLGLPYAATDPERSETQAHINAIRDALVGTEIGYAPSPPTMSLDDAVRAADSAGAALCLRGNYATAANALPDVLLALHGYTADATEEQEIVALRALVSACYTATSVAKESGYPDLAWIAAERGRQAATRLDDPALIGVAALCVGYAMESHRRDLVNTERALHRVEPHVGDDPRTMQVMGNLCMRAAYCSAIYGTSADVDGYIAEATKLAARTGETTDFNLFFGPTNVDIWRVSIAVEQGEGGRVPEIVGATDIEAMPSAWRRAMFHTDMARGLAQARRDADALEAFITAERLAPVYVRNNPFARETALDIRDRARRAAVGRQLGGLLYRMGLT